MRWRKGDGLTRRDVLRGSAVGAAALAAPRVARAVQQQAGYVPQSSPTQYSLRVASAPVAPDGAASVAGVLVNGSLPGPEIRVREGEQFRALVENGLTDQPTTIHWHGVLVPAGMDGVPDIWNLPIAPAQMYVYEYPIRQGGTYWYHSHYGFQEQLGMYGAFIVEPAVEPLRVEHDAVILLGDWMHADPSAVYAKLRGGMPGVAPGGAAASGMPMAGMATSSAPGATPADGMAMRGMPTAPTPAAAPMAARSGSGSMPPPATAAAAPAMQAMAMAKGADLSDVAYDAFLLNGIGGAQTPWSLAAKVGERIRLRIINGGASTYFRLCLDSHRLRVTHADGLAVEPVEVDHLLIGMGETYDAVVTLKAAGSYTLHAVAQDGSGQALGVLHTPAAAPTPNRAMPVFDGRALSYADLRAPAPTTLPDGPVRRYRLPLQGDMSRYVWMIDGQVWPDAAPLPIRRGERVEIELVNETSMWHPMHLHGHFFRLLQGAGELCPLKHTVNVAPGATARIEFSADNPGRWFFHCHNTFHLEAGMARVFEYVI